MKCISCGNPIPSGAAVCKLCGASQHKPSEADRIIASTKAKSALVFGILAILPLITLAFDASGTVFGMTGTFFGLPCGLIAAMSAFRLQAKGLKSRLATAAALGGALGTLVSGVAAILWSVSMLSDLMA